MKKYFAFFISCIAAVALASCQKEAEAPAEVKTHTVKFVAEPLTKTTMDDSGDKAVFSWTDSDLDRVHVFENGLPALSTEAVFVDGLMVISAKFNETSATSFTYTGFIAPYTSSVSNAYPSLISSSKNQGTLEGEYDGAYDMLIARAEAPADATGKEVLITFAYKRVVAIHKMTLKGLTPGAAVSKIIISADTPIIGYYDMDKDEWVKNTNSITVDCIEEVDAEGNLEVGYVSAPFENANVTVKVVYENGDTYKKVFAKALTVAESHVSYYNVSGFSCSDYVRLPWSIDGTQGKEGWDADGLDHSELGDYGSTHSPCLTRIADQEYVEIRYDVAASSITFSVKTFTANAQIGVYGSVDGETFTMIETKTVATQQKVTEYEVEVSEDYRYLRIVNVKNAASGFGLGGVSIAKASTEPRIVAEAVSVSAVGGTDLTTTYQVRNFEDDVVATYDGTIVTSASASNGTVTYSVAPNYTTTAKEGKITLTSAANPTAVKEITVTVAKSTMYVSVFTVTIPASSTSGTFTVKSPEFGWIAEVKPADGMNLTATPLSGTAAADAQTITVSTTTAASADEVTLGTIVLYRNGNTGDTQKKTVTIKRASNQASYYQKTTSIASGDKVLIGYGSQVAKSVSSSTIVMLDAEVSDGKVTSNSSVDACLVTVTEVSSGKYSLKLGNYYLGNSSKTSISTSTTVPTASSTTYLWTITFNTDGTALIKNASTSRFIGWNNTAGFKAYVVANVGDYPQPTLYK